jgi:hypothetical protein
LSETQTHHFYVTSIYCSPNKTDFIKNSFFDYFQEITENDCIFLGDFNIDVNKVSENKSCINCYETEGYKQLIENLTRVSDSSSSIIDHIYVNKCENISNYGVLQCAVSDHQPILVKRKLSFRSKTKNIKHQTIKYQDFKNINVKRVESDLLNMEMKLKDPQDLNEICN